MDVKKGRKWVLMFVGKQMGRMDWMEIPSPRNQREWIGSAASIPSRKVKDGDDRQKRVEQIQKKKLQMKMKTMMKTEKMKDFDSEIDFDSEMGFDFSLRSLCSKDVSPT